MKAILQSVFGPHPASTIVAIAVIFLAVRLAVRFMGMGRVEAASAEGRLADALFSGALLVNGMAHFTHGIAAEDFAAPFGYLLGPGLPSNLANVAWGFINLALGYSLLVAGKVFGPNRRRTFAFFAGVLLMGIFLSYVFSH